MKPHKHAELIKAWADGDEIEIRRNEHWDWVKTHKPDWSEAYEYRIKPAITQNNTQLHPVKELTDEEIEKVYRETHFSEAIGDCDFMEFARAILKKASEK